MAQDTQPELTGVAKCRLPRIFGEAVFVDEALRNISTWRFDPEVTTNLTVEYEFRLEKRTFDEGRNPRYEMRLPDSIRIIGATDDAYP